MSRALTVLIAAGVVLAGAQTAAAQYYAPADYYDAPPRYYDEPYGRYGGSGYYEDRLPFLRGRRYRDRPEYGYGPPRYDGRDPVYDYYLPERRGYPDDPAEEALGPRDDDATPTEDDQGFDPRRPHLGDGTDAPRATYYPRRPRSCGEYYYWDGRACVDARKYPPYVGPKP